MVKVLENFVIGNRTIKSEEDLMNVFINPEDLVALKKAGKIVVVSQHYPPDQSTTFFFPHRSFMVRTLSEEKILPARMTRTVKKAAM